MSAFGLCACGNPRSSRNTRCRPCQATKMREWRAANPSKKVPVAELSIPALEQRRAQDAARQAKHRGTILPKACEACGDPKAEMHHPDYTKPLEVKFLCPVCHASWHQHWRAVASSAFQSWLSQSRQSIACIAALSEAA